MQQMITGVDCFMVATFCLSFENGNVTFALWCVSLFGKFRIFKNLDETLDDSANMASDSSIDMLWRFDLNAYWTVCRHKSTTKCWFQYCSRQFVLGDTKVKSMKVFFFRKCWDIQINEIQQPHFKNGTESVLQVDAS